jgi:uncharacterized protein YecA (UPF0149 family)
MPKKKANHSNGVYSIDSGEYSRRYIGGKIQGIIKVNLDIGRNDLCPCNTGKKFKHCCQGKRVFFKKGRKRRGFLKRLFRIK